MRYQPLSSDFYTGNRNKFTSKMKADSIAIFFSNDVMPKSADGMFAFRQNADIQYLTGIDQEETILILFPDAPDPRLKEILFVRETSKEIAIWEGEKFSKEDARKLSGIDRVEWGRDYPNMLNMLCNLAQSIYLNLNEHERYSSDVQYGDKRQALSFKNLFPLHHFERIAPLMHSIRAVKEKEELDMMQKACDITQAAFERVCKFVKPGVMEFEVEAEIIHEFIRQGAQGHAYEPIIGSGYSSCVLHYNINNKVCKDGDVLLMDFGCSYGNYAADLTRVIPVNGKFTQRQKDVYSAVLRGHRYAAGKLVPNTLREVYQEEVGKYLQEEMLQLGLLTEKEVMEAPKEKPAYKKYFMHGTSHYLGLDVHDVGSKYRPMEAGMVLTVEPGIYINEENIGIRLENNYVIQNNGAPFDLMRNIALEIEDIESLMKR